MDEPRPLVEVPGLGPGRDWFGVEVELLGLMLLAFEVLDSDLTAFITELDDFEAMVLASTTISCSSLRSSFSVFNEAATGRID